MEENWKEVETKNNKKETYAEKVYNNNSSRLGKVKEKGLEDNDKYKETRDKKRENNKAVRQEKDKEIWKIERAKRIKEDDHSCNETEEKIMDISLERVERMQRMIYKMDDKIKKLENMVIHTC